MYANILAIEVITYICTIYNFQFDLSTYIFSITKYILCETILAYVQVYICLDAICWLCVHWWMLVTTEIVCQNVHKEKLAMLGDVGDL